ncbi:hypothetical protein Pyn_13368 [Prunus yedoensis var. nudiflora]|uniref:Uncharacterized protein n=1 Tax=Prunus yedoensis var. nudiflora TaxID=2094558 RepID=A0A314UV56_PRUYE|nr:hypothetical protein Pyn_13368 [Prunus yedoensis var. nudiflora]
MSYARGFENPNPSKQGGLKSEEQWKQVGLRKWFRVKPRLEMPIWALEVIGSAKMTATWQMVRERPLGVGTGAHDSPSHTLSDLGVHIFTF